MLKATIDKNENTCRIELEGGPLELANDLTLFIMNFTKALMEKHSKYDTIEIVTEACSQGVGHALEENE